MREIRFLDLTKNNIELAETISLIAPAIQSGQLVLGKEVLEFEKKIAHHVGRKYAVGVSSGTDALFLAIRALGIGVGDEVITTSLSWIATANAIKMSGATPIFADIYDDYNINCESVENLISEKTKAILFVNFTGYMANVSKLTKLANKYGLSLIEDASQSIGAKYENMMSGSFGIVSAVSHNPMKIFGALGEAGSILTDDENLKEKINILRYNGTINRETCVEPSLNGRIDTIQAAYLIQKLNTYHKEIALRRRNAELYRKYLDRLVTLPKEQESSRHIYYTFSIRTKHRNSIIEILSMNQIETKIQHRLPMPMQPAYLGSKGEWENAKRICDEILCLPIHGKITEEDIFQISKLIENSLNSLT